jgi:ribosome-associated toxin RatA of RatAB toxin-antitoxin module
MTSIAVSHVFNAPIDEVFEAVINADKYPYVSRLVHVERIRPASAKAKDGVGTMREVELGVVWFREEFTLFDRPQRVDYRILEARPHFEHLAGSFCFKKQGRSTEVIWSTTLIVPSTLPPKLVEKMTEWLVKAAFKSTLMILDRKLQASRKIARIKQ